MKKIFTLRKRLMGIFSILLVRMFFIASTPDSYVHVTERVIDASELKNAIMNIKTNDENIALEKDIPVVKNTEKKVKKVNTSLIARYKGLGYKKEHSFIRQIINEFMPYVKKYSDGYDIPSSVVMALFINEFVIANKNRLTDLAAIHHNYGSLKQKSEDDPYLSDAFKKLLAENRAGVVKYKDDEVNETGEIIPSPFYSFKSKEAGIHVCIAFIADRVKSKHPNYVGKFNGLTKNDIYEWANGLYEAGYANKNGYPLDKKIIRIIRTYKLANI